MHDYRWLDYQKLPLIERFPPHLNWLAGVAEWSAGARRFLFLDPPYGHQWLNDIRLAPVATYKTSCPRVFISHRQIDGNSALRVAWLAWNVGFDYWLDVIDLDPQINQQVINLQATLGRQLSSFEKSILTAATIEMALLNCTHVLAVMTCNTAGSQWVPYEYGRAKHNAPVCFEAACWFDKSTLQRTELPEYLHLGDVLDDEQEICAWLQKNIQKYPGCPGAPSLVWPYPTEPPQLPGEGQGSL